MTKSRVATPDELKEFERVLSSQPDHVKRAYEIALRITNDINNEDSAAVGLALQTCIMAIDRQAPGFSEAMIRALSFGSEFPPRPNSGVA